ncbi:methyltransferase domain-containing protein [Epidermidibacterium keratini]|uniref:Methyltransferase domain-containing protein n=1 Tax=Epidermidibacterium keratini TaxID=1891644 RepID=A0A7L4YMR2_9ACTN|nr:class I SAM-dependent methyltransferase [Epidermidibacterium keratini]QHB99826.1 methyltransferase domain-containing protein [Epidermidibacterium keratini]
MPDAIFENPRLAAVYDALDPDRSDLDEYARVVLDELGATRVLDIGCGTGTFALLLAARGLQVTGIDPATASIAVAREKPGAGAVMWIVGTTSDLPPLQVDAATMTANVAQVFLDDDDWLVTLRAARSALRPGGTLVFEARRPEDRAWERWTKGASRQVVPVPGVGDVEDWVQVTQVDGELVTFDSPTIFHADGERIESTSTLRFRSREAIEQSLVDAGFDVADVRDLAYAPGRSWLYLARRPAN